jgi:hypothetical protein
MIQGEIDKPSDGFLATDMVWLQGDRRVNPRDYLVGHANGKSMMHGTFSVFCSTLGGVSGDRAFP